MPSPQSPRKPYTHSGATARTPALIVYLLDFSRSMSQLMSGKRRIDVVRDALWASLTELTSRSMKIGPEGTVYSPRYRIAIIAYSDTLYDMLGGVKTIDQVSRLGELPRFEPMSTTETARAFEYAEGILEAELPNLQDCPAPLVCHMTDGMYTGHDPRPVIGRIKAMSVKDGHVLIENIFVSDQILYEPIVDPKNWPGIMEDTPLRERYAYDLREFSSLLPQSYIDEMNEYGYALKSGAVMMLPGESPGLVAMGFQMSTATK